MLEFVRDVISIMSSTYILINRNKENLLAAVQLTRQSDDA